VTVLEGEGRVPILYGSQALPSPPYPSVYLARPDLDGRYPPVVVVHEAVTSSTKSVCRLLARHGYVAVAPDLANLESTVDWASARLAVLGSDSVMPAAQALAVQHGAALVLLGAAADADPDGFGDGAVLGVLSGEAAEIRSLHEAAGGGRWLRVADVGARFHDEGSEDFRQAAATQAHEQIVEFLDRHLATPAIGAPV
jgi:hypothetical protein